MPAPRPPRTAGLTRRTTILTGSAAALAAASPARAAARWRTPFGLSAADFKTTSANLGGQGYRLVHLDGYALAGAAAFAAIWDQSPGPAWTARVDLTADQHQAALAELGAQGYRLSRVSGYEVGGQALYAGLWTQAPGPAPETRIGLSLDAYRRAFGDLAEQGYRLTWVRGYAVDGAAQFAAIFENDDGPDFMARHGLDAAGYQAALAEAQGRGYRLRHVCGYTVGDTPNFAAIWEYGVGPAWQAQYNLAVPQLQASNDALAQQGYWLRDISGYAVGTNPIYAAIWINDGTG